MKTFKLLLMLSMVSIVSFNLDAASRDRGKRKDEKEHGLSGKRARVASSFSSSPLSSSEAKDEQKEDADVIEIDTQKIKKARKIKKAKRSLKKQSLLEAMLADDLVANILTFLSWNDLISKGSLIDQYFKKLIESNPQLVTALDLSKNVIIQREIKNCPSNYVLAKKIAQYTLLKKLIFPKTLVKPDVLQVLAPCLGNLECFNFSLDHEYIHHYTRSHSAVITNNVITQLASYLGKLRQLVLDSDYITDRALTALVTCLGDLEDLDLKNCDITDEGLIPLVSHLPHARKVCLEGCANITKISLEALADRLSDKLQIFSLVDSPITDVELKLLAQRFGNLKELTLVWCEAITDEGLLAVAKHLGNNLQHLNLCGCTLVTDMGFRALACHFNHIKHLNLNKCDVTGATLIEFLPYFKNLENLNIGECNFANAEELKTLLGALPHLKELYLDHLDLVTDDLLKFIAHHLPGLEKLSVRGCNSIAEEGMSYLIAHHDKLQRVDYDETEFMDTILGRKISQLYHTHQGIVELRKMLRTQLSSSQSSGSSRLQ